MSRFELFCNVMAIVIGIIGLLLSVPLWMDVLR